MTNYRPEASRLGAETYRLPFQNTDYGFQILNSGAESHAVFRVGEIIPVNRYFIRKPKS